jgi:hypothetical protein
MKNPPENPAESARTTSDTGAFVAKAADAATPSNSVVGRVGAAASAVSIGARLLPTGWRMLRRYPLAATVAIAGLVCVAYLVRPARKSV